MELKFSVNHFHFSFHILYGPLQCHVKLSEILFTISLKMKHSPVGTTHIMLCSTACMPLLFYDKCPGFFCVHYTTHGTYSFTSHPKDEAIMVKCLAQGHKLHVQCTRPLGHDTHARCIGFKVL